MPQGYLVCLLLSCLLSACAVRPAVPPPAAVPAAPAAAVPKRPEKLPERPDEAQIIAAVDAKENLFFVQGSAELDAAANQALAQHALRLKANPRQVVTLVGHADDLGSPAYDLAIAERRVQAVYKALRGLGVGATQLRSYSVGSEKLSLACRSEACRRRMRRVELVYSE
ncbi:MAG: OmpA family protein [Dechloromonas sp.]|uniref:OmpA family protein n=1 Tax=Azonexus sp. TaxID=1872668 RepID=UPI0035B3CE9A|nr:OmpA family protein [Dechloromonas sp.]